MRIAVQFYHPVCFRAFQWFARQTGPFAEGVPVVISGMASADIGLVRHWARRH